MSNRVMTKDTKVGQKALILTASGVLQAKVYSYYPGSIIFKDERGMLRECLWGDDNWIVLVPKTKWPKPWRKVLKDSGHESALAVAYTSFPNMQRTTLVNVKTLATATVKVRSEESGRLYHYEGDTLLSESKLDQEDSQTEYSVGIRTLCVEDDDVMRHQ